MVKGKIGLILAALLVSGSAGAQTVGTYNDAGGVTRSRIGVETFSPLPFSSVTNSPATSLLGASGNVANAAAVATLTGTATTRVYITGFTCTPGGSTAAALVNVTVAGLLGGTATYTAGTPAGATAFGTPLNVTFDTPHPASAVNTAIVVTMPALGAGNTNAACVATGFYM